MIIIDLPVAKLREAPWNANCMDEAMLARLKESIRRYGLVENLVVRKVTDDTFEVISGNQRLNILHQTDCNQVPCVVVDLDDAHARLLAQALNNIQGEDNLGIRAELIRHVLDKIPEKDVLAILPETGCSLQAMVSLGTETIAEYLQKKQLAQTARLKHMQFQLTPAQYQVVEEAIAMILSHSQKKRGENPNLRGNALYLLCKAYIEKERSNEK